MRIDSHQHFWRYSPEEFGWIDDSVAVMRRDFLPSDLRPLLDETGFDGCVAVQAPQTLEETRFLLDLAEANPWIMGVVGWIDLLSEDLEGQLAEFEGRKALKGLRHIVQGEPAKFLFNWHFRKNIAKLSKLGLTYDLLIYHHQMVDAMDFVWSFPNLKIVLDHIAKPEIRHADFQPWARNMKKLSKFDNLYVKLSGMSFEADWATWDDQTIKPYIDHTIDCFEPSRCMIGSDWPVCLPAGSYAQTMAATEANFGGLSETDRDRILGGTAAEFYGLA